MKYPFDLESAKAGAPLITRGGAHAQLILHDKSANKAHSLVVRVRERLLVYNTQGRLSRGLSEHVDDLFIVAPQEVHIHLHVTT